MSDEVERLAEFLSRRRRLLAFTGAGISTESGIPDFRSPGGLWERYAPIWYEEFLTDPDARRESWRRGLETYATMVHAQPNAGHRALARLESLGVLLAVVTQNIDGLHQLAGHADGRVIELHGNARWVRCLECQAVFGRESVHDQVRSGEEIPACRGCGTGMLKTTTIAFGEPLDQRVLGAAMLAANECDGCLVVGSSLVVYPAAGVPERAAARSVEIAIVNATPTHLDALAAVVVRQPCGEALESAVKLAFDSQPS